MRARGIVAASTVGLVCAAAAASGPEDLAPQLRAYTGVWVRSDRQRDDLARAAEIDRATQGLPLLVRGIARVVIRRSMRPPERYVIRVDGEGLQIAADDDPEAVFRPGPEAAEVASGDETVTTRIAAGVPEKAWRHGENTHGSTRWRLLAGDDDEILTVEEEVHDRRMGVPLDIRTRYRRQPVAGP